MTAFSIPYPAIDPIIVEIGPLAVRWYGLMYLVAFVLGYFIIRSELRRKNGPIPVEAADDFAFYLIVGLLIGARIGYVLVYNISEYIRAPWEIFAFWHGGMSFHGGLAGMVIAGWIFSRLRQVSFLELADMGALAAPPGLAFGRIGNFINGELYGRVTDVPWGMVYPTGGDLPRHPSQIYQSLSEGVLLFALLWWLRRKTTRPGEILVLFLIMYGVIRFNTEFFREPDPQLGFIVAWLTMGQILCLLMILGGMGLYIYIRRADST
jgi:phosphatidylglycerol:prolipoprotein diacylglycerol transferase